MSTSLHGISSLAESLALLPASQQQRVIRSLSDSEADAINWDWRGIWARPNQLAPGTPRAADPRTNWSYWLILAGRGFGKTRCGAETVREWSATKKRIALVGPTAADVRDVIIEGSSGILACSPPHNYPLYEPSKRRVTWPNGAMAIAYSGDEPERLRGPQHDAAYVDELAAFRFAIDAWDNLMFGLRQGDNPQVAVTTTPKPVQIIRQLVLDPDTVITRGSSYENRANLAPNFFKSIIKKYEGTRLGRQELLGELLEDIPGALWARHIIDSTRVTLDKVPQLVRVVVAIDPAVTAAEDSDETGIGAVGLGIDGHLYVLQDVSQRSSPNQWARAACALFLRWSCDRMVAEVNNGGDLVEANLRAVHRDMPYRAVRASRGKMTRAEPVAALYEQRRVHHVQHPAANLEGLEDQMCSYVPGVSDGSPDRMDWLVWACFDLVIQPQEAYTVSVLAGRDISPY